MKVWEVMERDYPKVTLRTKILEAKALMKRTGTRILPVLRDLYDGVFEGFLTRYDVIKVTSLISDARAVDFMRIHPVLYLDMDIDEAAKVMVESGLKALPVLKSPQEPICVGTLSLRDLLRALISLGYSPKAKSINEVYTPEYVGVDADERINRVWAKFVEDHVPAVLVFKGDRLWGIITPKDLVDQRAWMFHREAEGKLPTPGKVKRFMTRGVVVAQVNMPVDEVAKFMVEHDFSLLPVVDDEGRVMGVVTQEDVVRAYLWGGKPSMEPVPVFAPAPPLVVETYQASRSMLQQVLVSKPIAAASRIKVSDVMDKELCVVKARDTIARARRLMLKTGKTHLLVDDGSGRIIGYVSRRGILRALTVKGPLWRRRARDPEFLEMIATFNPPVVSPDASIEEAAALMLYHNVDALLVKEGESLLGMLTKNDLAREYMQSMAGRAFVENLMHPGRMGVVTRHHSMGHVVRVMEMNYLDALVVADGERPIGLISENKMIFTPLEGRYGGIKRRRILWVRKLERAGRKMGRYVKVTPLLAEDFMVEPPPPVSPRVDVVEALRIMFEHDVDGVPVVDQDRLVGIITKSDVIRELARSSVKPMEERVEEALRQAKAGIKAKRQTMTNRKAPSISP
ncbi:MAG: CBS domain-containing protein [Thermoprotei archaeon]|nr:MAG: CBS domain-containing protein [Thermoprotei archaeon]